MAASGYDAAMAERPFGWYAGLIGLFAAAVGGFVRVQGEKLPPETSWGDLALVALASHKLSRLIAKDEVTTVARAPVTRDEEASEPKPTGAARALGELVTCPYCIGLWLAAAFSAGIVVRPRELRFVASVFAAHAGADLLHAAFLRLKPES